MPCVIADSKGAITYIHGRTGRFLEPAPGKAAMNVLQMARKGLDRHLPTMLRVAASQGKEIRRENLRVQANGEEIRANVTVKPIEER